MQTLSDHLMRDYWHLVAHRSELAGPGAYLRLAWALGDLVLYNDQGVICAFDNLCPHRGTRFFTKTTGSGAAVCPYHGWSLKGGELRIPQRAGFRPCEIERAALNTFQTAWCGDFLFVGVAPAKDLTDQLGEMAPALAAISGDIAGRSDVNVQDFACDWRVAVENALEGYHVNMVHPGTLAPLALTNHQDILVGPGSIYRADLGAGRTAKGLEAVSRFFDLQAQHKGYTSLHIFPFAMLSSTYGYSYSLQTFLPAEQRGHTAFVSRLLTSRTVCEADHPVIAALIDSTVRMNRQVFDEDRVICERVSPRYDLMKDNRIFGAMENRARHFYETLKAIDANLAEPSRTVGVPWRGREAI